MDSSFTHGRYKNAVSVRIPIEDDWVAIAAIVRRHHKRTIFGNHPFSETKYKEIEEQLRLKTDHQQILVADAKDIVVGLAWITAGEYLLSETVMVTVQLVAIDVENCTKFTSAKVMIRLIQGIKIWSKSRQAQHTLMHVTTGVSIANSDRIIKAMGGTMIGGNYIL